MSSSLEVCRHLGLQGLGRKGLVLAHSAKPYPGLQRPHTCGIPTPGKRNQREALQKMLFQRLRTWMLQSSDKALCVCVWAVFVLFGCLLVSLFCNIPVFVFPGDFRMHSYGTANAGRWRLCEPNPRTCRPLLSFLYWIPYGDTVT